MQAYNPFIIADGSASQIRLICLAALVATVAACDRSEPPLDLPAGNTTELTLTETFRIGDEAAGDTVFLGDDVTVSVDSRGQVYVTDRDLHSIRVFSGTGDRIGTIGRAGEGPGEFASRPQIQVGPADTLYALETRANRITVFAPDNHALVETIDVSGADSFNESFQSIKTIAGLLGVTPDGIVLHYSTTLIPMMADLDAPNPAGIRLLGRSGVVSSEKICELPSRDMAYAPRGIGGFWLARLPYGRDAFFALSRDNLMYCGRNDAIEIEVRSVDGSVRYAISVPHEPVPISAAERDRALAKPPELKDRIRSLLPKSKPAFEALLVDDGGRVWLRLSTPEGAADVRWIVLDLDGNNVAFTMLPVSVWLQVVDGDRAFGVSQVEDSGAPIVVAYDISS